MNKEVIIVHDTENTQCFGVFDSFDAASIFISKMYAGYMVNGFDPQAGQGVLVITNETETIAQLGWHRYAILLQENVDEWVIAGLKNNNELLDPQLFNTKEDMYDKHRSWGWVPINENGVLDGNAWHTWEHYMFDNRYLSAEYVKDYCFNTQRRDNGLE